MWQLPAPHSRCPSAEMQSAMLHLQRRIAGPVQSFCTNLVQVSTPGGRKLPAAVDVQTALLLGLAEAAAKAKLATKMLAFNVSRWEQPSSGYACCVQDMQQAACPLEAQVHECAPCMVDGICISACMSWLRFAMHCLYEMLSNPLTRCRP